MSEKITVVVSVYNMENYLHRCMNSFLEQTYTDYEIILIDDGSTDSSAQLCDSYAARYSNKVRCIHKENGGLSSARNCGIEAAKGKYIIFPDPDDWVEPDYLQRFIDMKQQYPNAIICCGYLVEFEEKNTTIANKGKTIVYNREQGQLHLLKPPKINGFAWNKLYNTQVIMTNNLRFSNDAGTVEDMDFAFRYMQHIDKVVHAAEYATYHYVQRVGSATLSGYSTKKMDGIRVYEKMIMTCPENKELQREAKSAICCFAINLMVMYLVDNIRNEAEWSVLRNHVNNTWKEYLFDRTTNIKRKIMTLIARLCPRLLKILH